MSNGNPTSEPATRRASCPALIYESARFRVAGTTADWKLAEPGTLTFALRARYSLADGYEADDAPILDGMEERKGRFWAGGAVTWRTDLADVSLDVMKDASGDSKGTQVRFGVEHSFRAGRFGYAPRASVIWADSKYVDYYYGVRPGEARSDRSAYQGASTTSFQLGLRVSYLIDRHHSLFADGSVTMLGNGMKDSPLVDRSTVPVFFAGYLYRF